MHALCAQAWAAQLLLDGVFNADPHAGNLLARQDAELGAVPILLDFGMVKQAPPPPTLPQRGSAACTSFLSIALLVPPLALLLW